ELPDLNTISILIFLKGRNGCPFRPKTFQYVIVNWQLLITGKEYLYMTYYELFLRSGNEDPAYF
ncbi:MAG: hypothetical protein KAS65_02685, partial [Candidatus Aminicenantes bacterium]|nr:hypothetical protein [Candidatus Aminicenantes bacterium]